MLHLVTRQAFKKPWHPSCRKFSKCNNWKGFRCTLSLCTCMWVCVTVGEEGRSLSFHQLFLNLSAVILKISYFQRQKYIRTGLILQPVLAVFIPSRKPQSNKRCGEQKEVQMLSSQLKPENILSRKSWIVSAEFGVAPQYCNICKNFCSI